MTAAGGLSVRRRGEPVTKSSRLVKRATVTNKETSCDFTFKIKFLFSGCRRLCLSGQGHGFFFFYTSYLPFIERYVHIVMQEMFGISSGVFPEASLGSIVEHRCDLHWRRWGHVPITS